MRVVADIEADSFWPSRIWVIVTREVGQEDTKVWLKPDFPAFIEYAKGVDEWVFHNGLNYDVPHINRLLGEQVIDPDTVWDTFVLSRMIAFNRFNGHGLDEIGQSIGVPKTHFDDFSHLSQEMIDYCIDDVNLGYKVYQKFERFIDDTSWRDSIVSEHRTARLCFDMHCNGFMFDVPAAKVLHADIRQRMDDLEAEFSTLWPPVRTEVNRIKYRIRKDGQLYPNVAKTLAEADCERDGSELVIYEYITFNPGSTKDRVDELWAAGWQPIEKTDSHYKFSMKGRPGKPWGKKAKLTEEEYAEKKAYFDHYGWKVNEENLETLPDDAPEGAAKLAQWLTLNGRLKPLEERLTKVSEDGRLRSKFWHIGAWTHRMASSDPNLQNLSSPWHGEAKNPVQVVKELYDSKLREMFIVPEGAYLVGTDAESIQLRILAHYLKNDDYVHAIVSGLKEEGNDIHNVNRRALGLPDITRGHAKTFIYAWLLGAGVAKVARILGCSLSDAKRAVDNFIANTEGLGELRSGLIQRDASRGYFTGLDGRRVVQNEAYYMLAGYLQNGETLVMKHANWMWYEQAKTERISFKQVNFVHDEWQTEVTDSYDAACRLGELQCEALEQVGKDLNVYCPLSGETKIGTNWLETH